MICVTLIGADGSGKSAVTKRLAESMPVPVRRIYMGVNLESSNIMLPTSRLQLALRRWRGLPPDSNGPRDPKCAVISSGGFLKRILRFLKANIRIANLLAEELYRLIVIQWWLLRGFLVIQDRDFFIDYYEYDVIDNGHHRTLSQRIHGWFLRTVYRKPDLTILLDVSSATMRARKGEGTEEDLDRRLKHYRELIMLMPAHEVINAEGTLPEVTARCRDSILCFRLRRLANSAAVGPVTKARPPVIVIGIDCVTGLQTARTFRQLGIRVIGLASRINHFCCRTNSVESIHECELSGPELVGRLLLLRETFGQRPVLVPCTDLSVLTISRHQEDLLPWYSFVLPEHDLLETLIDKVRFAEFAEAKKLGVPRTRVLNSLLDSQQAAVDLFFPVFLKPAVKTATWEANTRLKAVEVHSATELLAAWNKYSQLSDSLIAQEYIPGGVEECFTVNAYFNRHSQVVCSYTSQKMRQWPPGFGTASLACQANNATVVRQALEFFRSVEYTGLGYIEFKRDHRTGEYLIIEPNIGRPTGRSAMADASGVPLLYSMYCEAAGIQTDVSVDSVQQPQPLKWIHLRRDLQAAIHAWKNGQLTIRGWLESLRGPKISAVASWEDPHPFLAEIHHYILRQFWLRGSKKTMRPISPEVPPVRSVPNGNTARVTSGGRLTEPIATCSNR